MFDDPVRVGSRNRAIRNDDGADVMGGRPFVRQSRTLVIPLKPNLRDGNYTARWSIVSDDGHPEEGVIAFGVGKNGSPPTAALGARGFVTWQQVTMRATFFLGVLAAVGAAFFALIVLRSSNAGEAVMKRHALLLGGAFLIAFVGADALIRSTAGSATRFERVLDVAAVAAVVGAVGAAAALRWGRAIYLAWAAAALLFVCPTLAGHALDRDQPKLLAPLGDLLHLGAAAVWLGGLASLLLVFPREEAPARDAAARRFSSFAIPMVLVLVAGGVSRALTQLDSVSQLWETSYGRTLLVKSGLLLVLVALGWLNRGRLASGFARMRPIVLAELLLLLVVVGAVGVLTDLRPGSAQANTPKPTPPRVQQPPPAPPRRAFVDAGQAGPIAVGFAYQDGRATVTLTGGDGDGVTDRPVTIDGRPGEDCGRGCFTLAAPGPSVAVGVGARNLRFDVPKQLRPATAEVNRLRRDFDALQSVVIDERLSSGPGSLQVSRFRQQAPGNMAYRDHGRQQREAGRHRGDRDRQPPLGQAARRRVATRAAVAAHAAEGLLDGLRAQRVLHRAGRGHVLRPDLPRVVPPPLRPADGPRADAADDRHSALHAPPLLGLRPARVDLAAALAVALRLALDHLEEARRVLERGEAGGRVARAAGAAEAPRRGDRPGGADEAAERERTDAGARGEAPLLVVHATILRCRSRRSATCSST